MVHDGMAGYDSGSISRQTKKRKNVAHLKCSPLGNPLHTAMLISNSSLAKIKMLTP